MTGAGTPGFFRLSKKDKPFQKITGITAAKSGIKSVKGGDIDIPPIPGAPDPAPTPDSISQGAAAAGAAEQAAAKKRRGRRSLILTRPEEAGLGQKTSLLGA